MIPGPETAQEATNEPTEGADTLEGENEAQETEEKPNKAAREAAKYRTQLREAEAALEAANARIEGFQRAEVERIAGAKLAVASDLFALTGTSVADYLSEDGTVDTKAVENATQELLQSRPGLRKPARVHDPSQGLGNYGTSSSPSWSDLLSR